MNHENDITIRAAVSTLVVFSLMTLPFCLGFLWLHLFRGLEALPALLTGALWLLACLWWQRFRLQIDPHALSYRTLFGGTRQVRLADIDRVVHAVDFRSRGFRPPIRLEVFSRESAHRAFDINLKVFSLEDIRRVNTILKPYISAGH